jgi:hypothetical protein
METRGRKPGILIGGQKRIHDYPVLRVHPRRAVRHRGHLAGDALNRTVARSSIGLATVMCVAWSPARGSGITTPAETEALSRSPMKPGTEARLSPRLGEDCETVASKPASFQVDRHEAATQTMARCVLLT